MSDQDRELLELAAKAAGYVVADAGESEKVLWIEKPGSVPDFYGERPILPWDPLIDDGDALRLAADLDINVEWFPRQRYVSAGRLGVGESIGWVDESGRHGALRRAITVAASRIGRAKP